MENPFLASSRPTNNNFLPGPRSAGLGLGEPNDVQPVGDDFEDATDPLVFEGGGPLRDSRADRQTPHHPTEDGRGQVVEARAPRPRMERAHHGRARLERGPQPGRGRGRLVCVHDVGPERRPTRAARPRGTTAEGRSARSRRCTGCRAAARPRAPTARSARCARGRARGPRARRRAGARRARGPGPARRRDRPRHTDRRARRARLSPQVQARASRAGTGASPEARPRSLVRTRARSPS